MRVLTAKELVSAEKALKDYFPKSLKVYGHIFSINRCKSHTTEVLVDSWPDFKTIICRSSLKGCRVDAFTKDEDNLRTILKDTDVLNWSGFFLLGGVDFCHLNMVKEVAAYRNAPLYLAAKCFMMMLENPDHLPKLPVDRVSGSRITSLNMSHVDLVNKAWKFGGDESGARIIQTLILNFPSCCIVDESGKPVSWILTYEYCAMGILYTSPEHRGKGYAKTLVTAAAKSLQQQGYPIYCFIEEDNERSYRLFKDLGFKEVPDYRAAWFRLNDDIPNKLIS
ncbi:glycine N-acyltransferase-like protein 3 [Huso huso]|uniref:Glycine N-acyltransferase-like protein n=1 Tax=Huso huso TaxID=61971 RepID=A0ABR0ZWJ0_HUSHU